MNTAKNENFTEFYANIVLTKNKNYSLMYRSFEEPAKKNFHIKILGPKIYEFSKFYLHENEAGEE